MAATDFATILRRRDTLCDDAPATSRATAQQIIAQVLEQHSSTDVAALTSLVLDRIPKDQGTLWRLLQQLVSGEIRRLLAGEGASTAVGAPAAALAMGPVRERTSAPAPRHTQRAATLGKWEVYRGTANDPLQARVHLGDRWARWADLTAEDLRAIARRDEASATKLLARVVALDALASDLEAAGCERLGDLPGATERIGGL